MQCSHRSDAAARRTNGKPSVDAVDVRTGFIDKEDKAHGRPVELAIGGDGSLLVADDVGNTIWRVSSVNNHRKAAVALRQ